MTLKFHYLPVVLMQSFGPGLKGREILHPSETPQKKKKKRDGELIKTQNCNNSIISI